jgi:hypothetical protein
MGFECEDRVSKSIMPIVRMHRATTEIDLHGGMLDAELLGQTGLNGA